MNKYIRPGISNILFLGALASFAFTSNAAASAAQCRDIFNTPKIQLIFAKGVDAKKNPKGFMQIGYESEYLFSEAAGLLKDYAPAPEVIPTATWKQMSDQQHIEWLQAQFKDRPEYAVSAGLKKQVDLDFMPAELIIDSTGNVEIVLAPFDSYHEWNSAVDIIVQRYGVGSQQAMVSKARESAFVKNNPQKQKELHQENLGWLVFSNLKDTFLKLDSGYDRFLADGTKLTALSFDHPFLGPMTKVKRDVLEEYLVENAKDLKYDDASKNYVRKSDASFKYTGGPSYRPDVAGPGRFSWEIRNAHKDVKDLKMKVRRDLNAHAQGLEAYRAFADVPAFDSVKTFDALPKEVRETLMKLFPSKADPRFEYNSNEKLALEMYRNFSMPMMDLNPLAMSLESSASGRMRLATQILHAQKIYLSGLKDISHKVATGALTLPLAKAQVMGLLGGFARNSGIPAAFERAAEKIGHEGELLPIEAKAG